MEEKPHPLIRMASADTSPKVSVLGGGGPGDAASWFPLEWKSRHHGDGMNRHLHGSHTSRDRVAWRGS